MAGVFVNVATVLAGSLIGLLFRRGIPERITHAIMDVLGLCTVCLGIQGIFQNISALIMILALVLGTAAGTLIDLDRGINALGSRAQKRFAKAAGGTSIAQGFVTASLLFCVGSMTVVGCLQAGLQGNYEMLFTKSLLDFISSMVLSVSLGVGVLLAAAFVLVVQGALVLFSGALQPILTTEMIGAITCVGSVSILALGLNLLGITKIKVANQLPALVLAPIVYWLFTMAGIG